MQPMLTIALKAARKAGEIIARSVERLDTVRIDEKSANNFVTEIDRAAEKEILYHLKKAYPDHAFLGEETGHSGAENAEYRWIIDPLDGTT
ncbi:MAG TPA: inositol monophosphatase family protein, partial [Spongiibacteraceae bacterium]|nr:inositol monophosphatase family protein [Spongiibacteraceae bacterium]